MLRRRATSIGLIAVAVWWAHIDSRFEGPLLLRVDQQHGLVTADLVSIALVFLAGWIWFA